MVIGPFLPRWLTVYTRIRSGVPVMSGSMVRRFCLTGSDVDTFSAPFKTDNYYLNDEIIIRNSLRKCKYQFQICKYRFGMTVKSVTS